jgi:DNA-binding transcriptional LysR family regulator
MDGLDALDGPDASEATPVYNHQLDTFLAVAELGSISAAARRCFVSQPAVSQQISALEGQLGVQLFERTTRGMRLTEAGRVLQERARQIVDIATATQAELHELGQEQGRTLTVATNATVSEFLTGLVSGFCAAEPGWHIAFFPSSGANAVDPVERGEADLSLFCRGSIVRGHAVVFEPLFVDEAYCMLSRTHPLAGSDELRMADLADMSLILPPRGYADEGDLLGDRVEAGENGMSVMPYPHPSEAVTAQTVALNTNVAAVVFGHHSRGYPGVVFRRLVDGPHAEVGLVRRPEARSAVRALVRHARAACAGMPPRPGA